MFACTFYSTTATNALRGLPVTRPAGIVHGSSADTSIESSSREYGELDVPVCSVCGSACYCSGSTVLPALIEGTFARCPMPLDRIVEMAAAMARHWIERSD